MFTPTMITELVLTNFKCFKEETHIPLSKLNIFTGTNGSGKSSAIQALLLLAQRDTNNPEYLPLNGRYVNLGSISEVGNKYNLKGAPISIGIRTLDLESSNISALCNLKLGDNNDNQLGRFRDFIDENLYIKAINIDFSKKINGNYGTSPIEFDTIKINLRANGIADKPEFFLAGKSIVMNTWHAGRGYKILSHLNLNIKKEDGEIEHGRDYSLSSYSIEHNLSYTYYIPADRIGPKSYYLKAPFTSWTDLGLYTEKTLSFILKQQDQPVRNRAMLQTGSANTYIEAITLWLSYIFENLTINIESERDTIHLTIDGINPTMTGFGYSYVLPIIYAGLEAPPDTTIIIDNPELHLTPKSQSRLMEFLCKVANSGVQVFIETHSDHIVNGACVMLRERFNQKSREDGDSTKGISPDDISILWFENDKESSNTNVTQVEVKENGKYGHIPKGFFDQIDNDLNKILGFTK